MIMAVLIIINLTMLSVGEAEAQIYSKGKRPENF